MYMTPERLTELAHDKGKLFVRYLVGPFPDETTRKGPKVTIIVVVGHTDKLYRLDYSASHADAWSSGDPLIRYSRLLEEERSDFIRELEGKIGWTLDVPEAASAQTVPGQQGHIYGYHTIPTSNWLIVCHLMRMRDRFAQDIYAGTLPGKLPVELQPGLHTRLNGLVAEKFKLRLNVDGV